MIGFFNVRVPLGVFGAVSVVVFMFLLDIFISGMFFDLIAFLMFGFVGLFFLSRRFALLGIFLFIMDLWFFLPRLIWRNDVAILDPLNWFRLVVPVVLVFVFLFFLTLKPRTAHTSLPMNFIILYLLVFIVVSYFNALLGRQSFVNRVDVSFLNLVLYIPAAVLPYLLVELFINNRVSIFLKFVFLICVVFIFGATGSKFALVMNVFLPLFTVFFTFNRTNFFVVVWLSFVSFFVIFISFVVGNSVRLGRDLYGDLLIAFDSVSSVLGMIFGRLNFLAISNSSLDYWGRYPNDVFDPLVLGLLPRFFAPSRLDVNNGQWFGELIGLTSFSDNTYVASTIFVDLLLGGSWLLSSVLVSLIFLFLYFVHFVFRRLFFSSHFFIIFVLINFILSLEMNFAFVVTSMIKQFFLIVFGLWLPCRTFTNLKRVFRSNVV